MASADAERIIQEQLAGSPWAHALQPFLDLGIDELRGFVAHALVNRWDSTAIALGFQTTNYWKTTQGNTKAWHALSDADKAARVASRSAWVLAQLEKEYGRDWLTQHGLYDLNNWDVRNWATMIEDGRISDAEWIIGRHADAIIQPGTLAQTLYLEQQEELARKKKRPEELAEELWRQARGDYFVNLTKEQATVWANDIINGRASFGAFSDYIRGESAGLYKQWGESIKNGVLPKNLFAPALNILGTELEMSPDQIIANNRLWGEIVGQASGGKDVFTAADWTRYARNQSEWLQTDNARDMFYELKERLGRDLGVFA